MNERIKQISDQVWEWAENQEYSEPDQFSDIWETKFAELIVRECVGIAYEHDAPKMSGPGMIIAGRIEKHFGVEE